MPTAPSVSQAVGTGDRRQALIALRDRLAQDIDNTETLPRDRAAITKQLQSVLSEIDELPAPEPAAVTPLEAARRKRSA